MLFISQHINIFLLLFLSMLYAVLPFAAESEAAEELAWNERASMCVCE